MFTNHRLERKKRELREIRVGLVEPEVRPSFSDSIYPGLQRVGPSVMCNMLGERSRKSLQLMILRDLPHTYFCTCFYSKEKQRWKQKRTLPVLNTGEPKFYSNKKQEVLEAPDFIYIFFV